MLLSFRASLERRLGITLGFAHYLLAFVVRAFLGRELKLQPLQSVQQSANAGWVPFAAQWGWHLSLVQLARDGAKGDEALCLECANCRSQGLGFRICLLACLSIIDPAALAGRKQAQARQHPHYGGVMPATATNGRYPSSVQLIRQRLARNEASRPKLQNGRNQGAGAGVRGSLIGQCTMASACATIFFYLLAPLRTSWPNLDVLS